MVSEESSLVERFEAAMAALCGLRQTPRLCIAVSGGPDSMALLHLATLAFPGRVAAATVDHGLRAASADEAAMVADWCARHAIPHATLHPDTQPQGNIQAWARTARYALLEDWRAAQGLDLILTAHHADDQLETMLMRLNRGAGLSGLAGVRTRTSRIARPLLSMSKAELLAYVQAQGLPYADDPSNLDPRFDRAALRAQLANAPWLDAQAAARSAVALAEADVALRWLVDDLAARHVRADGAGHVLDATDFPREVQRRLLLRLIACTDPDAPLPRGEAVDRLLAYAMAGEKASIGALILQGGKQWRIYPAPPRKSA
ncbi:tRNA lysidine(34) synthetase TilS [Sphingobium aromaticiconvertens]|uniref:tRNA lysidine(34) synthetase TilS n=1 Tax=Sphingobium aromaticiconvertens TaxID=365341 RepID=UPI003AFB4C7A